MNLALLEKQLQKRRYKKSHQYCITTNFIQKPIFVFFCCFLKKKSHYELACQPTTTLSSRHTVKMARLRIVQISPGLLTASCHAPVLRRLRLRLHHRAHGLWIGIAAPWIGTWIYAWIKKKPASEAEHDSPDRRDDT